MYPLGLFQLCITEKPNTAHDWNHSSIKLSKTQNPCSSPLCHLWDVTVILRVHTAARAPISHVYSKQLDFGVSMEVKKLLPFRKTSWRVYTILPVCLLLVGEHSHIITPGHQRLGNAVLYPCISTFIH